MLNTADIRVIHHRRLLKLRSQDRIIQSSLFEKAWETASKSQQYEAMEYIKENRPVELNSWVSKVVFSTLDRFSMKILRQVASHHRIKNYSRMDKAKLVHILKKKGVKHDDQGTVR